MTFIAKQRAPEERRIAEECVKIIADKRRSGFWSKNDALANYVRDQTLLRIECDIRAEFGLGAEKI